MASGEHTREYLTIKRNVTEVVSSLAAQVDPGLFAQRLNQDGLVSAHVVYRASVREIPASNRIQDIIQAVLAMISLDPSKYQVFIETLRTEYRPLADKLTQCYDPSAKNEQAATTLPVSRNSNQLEGDHPATRSEPQLQPSEEEFPDLVVDFAGLCSKVVPLLQKVVAVDVLKLFLKAYFDHETDKPVVDPSLYEHLTTTEAILIALLGSHRFHPNDVGLLGAIVQSLGCEECKRLLREYECKIPKSRPLKRSHNDLTDDEIDSRPCAKRLKIKLGGEIVTLYIVETIKEGLERSSGVSSDMIVYAKHEPERSSETHTQHKVKQLLMSTESRHPSTGKQQPSTRGKRAMMTYSPPSSTTEYEAAITRSGERRLEYDEDPLDRKLQLEFDMMEPLGKGGFGVVYRVKSKLDGGVYALKIIKLPTSKNQENKVKREGKVLMGLEHSRILRYYQSWSARIVNPVILKSFAMKEDPLACAELSRYNLSTGGGSWQSAGDSVTEGNEGDEQPRSKYPLCLFIQTQLCRKGTLKDWLLKNMDNRPKDVVFDYFEQTLEAVVYIHDKGLIHRDLKPSNIFFSQDGGIKLGDFGLVAGNISPELSSPEQLHSGQVGTWFYMAPEQLSGQKYDQKVDIFALGVIFLELNYPLTAKERNQVHSDLRYKFELPERFTKESPIEAALAKKLLNREAAKRPSAKDVFEELKSSNATLRLRGQAFGSGERFSTYIQGISPKTLQDPVSAGSLGKEMDTTDSGVGTTQTQDSSHPSSVKVGALYGHLESAVAGDSQTHSGDLHPQFRGVHTLSGSPWHVSVTSEAKKIQWDEIGVLFNIPEGAVPPGKVLNLTVWPCIKGPFVPPPGYHFASPVFIVGPEFRFDKKILFQLSHFIQLQSSGDCENMVFLSARSTSLSSKDGKLGYRFKVLEGGLFEVGQPVGTISLSHFCAVAAGKKINAGGKVEYSVQLHHSDEAKKAIFVVSIVDKVYTKNVKDFLEEQYPGATFQRSIQQPVEFAAENEVTLHIPNPADSMSGWVIVSDKDPCKISRKEVDFPLLHSEAPCQIPDYPPKLLLNLEQSRAPQRPFRQCSLSVGGVMQPWSFKLVLRKSKHPGPPSTLLPFSQQPGKGNTTVGRLSCDDLRPVLKELVTACAEWEYIGLELNLSSGTLDAMKGPYKPPKDCLRDMLNTWLKTSPNPSWQDLIEALKSPLVGQDALARELESKYCS